MLRCRIHTLVHEHVIEGVGVFIGLNQACEAEADGPYVVSAFSQTPAEFCAVPLTDDATLAGLIASALVHIPLVSQALKGDSVFRNGKLPYGHGTQVAHGNVEFCSGGPGFGLPYLGNPGAAVLLQLHPDVYIPDITNGLSLRRKAKRQAYKN